MPKRFLIYCEQCGYRKIVNDTPAEIKGLLLYKTSKVQARLPRLDHATNKTIESEFIEQMPKYKCPQCGRVVTTKRLPKPLHEPVPVEEPKPDAWENINA